MAKKIPENGILIEFQKYQELNQDSNQHSYLAMTLKNNRQVNIINLGKADVIEKLINKAIIASEQSYADAQLIWDEISAKIIDPLYPFIKDSETIYLSPR